MTQQNITHPSIALAAPRPSLKTVVATTPGRLQAALGLIVVSAFVFWLAAAFGISATQHTIQTVGKDSVPSIVAAEEIRANLADMNANAVNDFLGAGGQVEASRKQYETDRQVACDRLVTAAQNITFGDEERIPIKTMVDELQVYTGQIAAARTLGVSAGLPTVLAANQRMHNTLLPAAVALDKANFTHLDSAFSQSRINAVVVQVVLFGSCLLALGVLLETQIFITKRTRRLINIPLAAATALVLLFTLFLSVTLGQENARIKSAKEDAFDSVHALWRARAIAFDANGDESLYLLDKANQTQYEEAFRSKSAQLADATITDQTVSEANAGRVQFKGLFGDELRNITFAGEREAAVKALSAYGDYMAIDREIRKLENSGNHQKAVDLCIGTEKGQSNWAFDQFNTALGQTLDINQKAFDTDIADAFAGLQFLPYVVGLVSLAVMALAWFGLQPRIQEYHI